MKHDRHEENGFIVRTSDAEIIGVASSSMSRQVGGSHYASKKVQPWAAMEAWMTPEAFEGYLHGNIIKYVARYKDKGGVQDLQKAQHYLDKLINFKGTA